MQAPHKLRVISWNILSDHNLPYYKPQTERLRDIASELDKHVLKTPTVIYICEAKTSENIQFLADKLKLKLVGACNYPNDHMGFITNTNSSTVDELNNPEMKIKYPKTKSLKFEYNGCSVVGVHLPSKIIVEIPARFKILKVATTALRRKKNALIIGDFNSMWFQPARLLTRFKGFRLAKNISNEQNDAFPSNYYKGVYIPKHTPKLPIDAHYYKGIKLVRRESINTTNSDHPILISDYTYS